VLVGAALWRVVVDEHLEVLTSCSRRDTRHFALERGPAVGACAVFARAPHAGVGRDEERLIAARVAGRAEEHDAVAEEQVAVRQHDVLRLHAFATFGDEPRLLHRVEIVPVVPFAFRREEQRVRKARLESIVLGAELAAEVLRVEVIERDVIDVRVRERLMGDGLLAESEVQKHLDALPDLEGQAVELTVKQPALQNESDRDIVIVRTSGVRPPIAPVRPADDDLAIIDDDDDDDDLELDPKKAEAKKPVEKPKAKEADSDEDDDDEEEEVKKDGEADKGWGDEP